MDSQRTSESTLESTQEQKTISNVTNRNKINNHLPATWHSRYEIIDHATQGLTEILSLNSYDTNTKYQIIPKDSFAPTGKATIIVKPPTGTKETLTNVQSLKDGIEKTISEIKQSQQNINKAQQTRTRPQNTEKTTNRKQKHIGLITTSP